MSLFSILMIVVILFSILFCWLTVNQIVNYNKKYHLPESKYTKLFRFISKEHITFIYILFISIQSLLGFWFIINL